MSRALHIPHRKGTPLKTPAGRDLAVPTLALARAIEEEWAVLSGLPKPGQIPLTQYANTALDHIDPARDGAINGWLSYAESDLLCHRAESPPVLVERQEKVWQPHLDWLAKTTGAQLTAVFGIMPHRQPEEAIATLRRHAERFDAFRLAVLSQATQLLGSAVLGLAFVHSRIDVTTALSAALLDELYQSERWGEPEELTIRRDDLTRELTDLHRFRSLLA